LHEAAELPYLQAEQDRLLYVAATRAREVLVVSRWIGNQKAPAWGVLNNFLTSAKELPIAQPAAPRRVEPLDCSRNAQELAEMARTTAHDRVCHPSWSVTSVTAEAHHIARMTRAADASVDDPTKVVGTDTPAHRADAGMAWGTLIHGLLEHAMRHQDATRDDLRRLALWLTVEEPQLRAVIDEAMETVERVAKADFWSAAQSDVHSVETPFMVEEARILTNGVIDLLFETEAGWRVIDYKTDHSLADERYAGQLEAYQSGLRKLGCPIAGASVLHVRAEVGR
jgi:ATP-dependent helicase/nuclease subunit A